MAVTYFLGDMDEISIYTTALSDARIQAHWQALGGLSVLLKKRQRRASE